MHIFFGKIKSTPTVDSEAPNPSLLLNPATYPFKNLISPNKPEHPEPGGQLLTSKPQTKQSLGLGQGLSEHGLLEVNENG
jgi:hypothetical protein